MIFDIPDLTAESALKLDNILHALALDFSNDKKVKEKNNNSIKYVNL